MQAAASVAVRSPLRLAIRAATEPVGPQRHEAGGRPVVCGCCGNERFTVGSYGFPHVQSLVCARCHHIELFTVLPSVAE